MAKLPRTIQGQHVADLFFEKILRQILFVPTARRSDTDVQWRRNDILEVDLKSRANLVVPWRIDQPTLPAGGDETRAKERFSRHEHNLPGTPQTVRQRMIN